MLDNEIATMSSEAKLQLARQSVIRFCSATKQTTDGGKTLVRHYSANELRSHYATAGADRLAKLYGVQWTPLIDSMFRERAIMCTNGFVWVPRG